VCAGILEGRLDSFIEVFYVLRSVELTDAIQEGVPNNLDGKTYRLRCSQQP